MLLNDKALHPQNLVFRNWSTLLTFAVRYGRVPRLVPHGFCSSEILAGFQILVLLSASSSAQAGLFCFIGFLNC